MQTWKVLRAGSFPLDEARDLARAGQNFARGLNPAGVARQLVAILASGSRKQALGAVRVPTLVIHGDIDPLVPLACGLDTAESVPGAKLLRHPGHGPCPADLEVAADHRCHRGARRLALSVPPRGTERCPATDPSAPPSRELLLLEIRAFWEMSAFFTTYPLLRLAPRGDGHPVLVLPGSGGERHLDAAAAPLPEGPGLRGAWLEARREPRPAARAPRPRCRSAWPSCMPGTAQRSA